jgi:glycine/D-amino acid oxidase-like deaminating enzyme/nitrite reductase/ring-hydroxylating ferredoxin subunit
MDPQLLDGEHQSIWMATSEAPERPPLEKFEHFDVLIVGGGIVGVATAYQLANQGLRVALLEARRILSDVTGNTTGKLTSQHGVVYRKFIETFGEERAGIYAHANEWAIRWVAETAERHGIACNFVPDSAFIYTTQVKFHEDFAAEREACESLGLPVEYSETADLPFEIVGALKFRDQARFHPRRFLLALAALAEQGGVMIHEDTRVLEVTEEEEFCRVQTERGPVLADRVVVATNYPIHDSGLFVAKLIPNRSYAMAADVGGHLPDGMFITADGEEPLRSLRRQMAGDREVLIVGGGLHKVGQEADSAECYLDLERWARMQFDVRRILYRWSTQDNFTADGMPYVGLSPNRKRIYVATGFFGWGMTNGFVSGQLLSDLILGNESPWAETYNPARMGLKSFPKIISGSLDAARHLVGDRIKRAPIESVDDLRPGDGGIVQVEGERVAAFRDDDGGLRLCSSACTHMGCQVHFNNAERSWDCPCHGSRFDVDGQVLHGPATQPLEQRVPAEKDGEPYVG